MHWVTLSVVCSVAVSVLLKLCRRLDIDLRQAIAVNYLVAAAMTLWLLAPQPSELLASTPALRAAWPVYAALALLLPSMFWVLGMAVRRIGMARTDAAQRLSLLLPLLAAFTLFGEALSWHKGFGVALGLSAVGLLLARAPDGGRGGWGWPLAVFAGMGAIDILFKQLAQLRGVDYMTSLLAVFALSLLVAALAVLVLYLRGRARPRWRHLGGGVLLGLLNFGNILCYVRAHRALPGSPALVFSAMNIGVIALGALIGLGVFGERLSGWNKAGIALGAVAVAVLATA